MRKDLAPREFKRPRPVKKGLLILYAGDGKGKSTAALGAALRTLGRGGRVGIVQFIKGPWISGEAKALAKFGRQVELYKEGDGFTWDTKDLEKDIARARKGWERCVGLLRKRRHHLLIFDELLYVLKYRFLEVEEVLKGLSLRAPDAHVILTGRDAPPELVAVADLVSEMKEVKHPYQQGIPAQPGLDY